MGGVVPGIGDEVSIFHTVSATDTWTFGVSLSSGSFALNLNSSGTLHITSTGKVFQRGYGTYTSGAANLNDAVDVDGGGDWAFDASASTSPTSLHYGMYPSGSAGFRKIKISGSPGVYATVYNVNPSTVGILTMNGNSNGGNYEFLYSSFVRVGFDISYNNNVASLPIKWDAQHSSFTNCALINTAGSMYSGSTFRHEYNYHQNSWGSSIFTMNFTSHVDDSTSAIRSIKGNVFDKAMNTNLATSDFTFQDNFMGAGYSAGSSSWSIFTGNFVRMNNNNANMGAEGILSNSYIWWDDDQQNTHVFSTAISSAVTFSGIVYGQSGRAKATAADDSGEFWLQSGPTIIATCTITNSIFLLNGAGYQGLQVTSLLGTASANTYSNNRLVCEHNTYAAGWDNSSSALPPFAMIDYSETSNMAPGTLSSLRDNLLWNPQISTRPAQFFKTLDAGNANANLATGFSVGPTTDVCNPSNCDYNASYQRALATATVTNAARYLNQGRGYAGNYSSTPGAHDINGQDPQFVDWVRNVELFDSKWWRPYYGLSPPSAWLSGGTYSEGNVVSHSSSTYYWGNTINYVYIDTGSCLGANPEPGVIPVRSWEKCWKFQSIEDIKGAVASSATFTDGTIGVTNAGVIPTLLAWVRAGYQPTNVAYHGSAHDGSDIGAVSFVSVSSDPLNTQYLPAVDKNPAHYSTALGTVTVTGSLYKITRSSVPAATSPHWFTGFATKNEFLSLQVHISPATDQPALSVSMSNLVDTQTTPSSIIYTTSTDIVVYREFYTHIATPTCLSTTSYHGGSHDSFPDILIPSVDPYWHQTTNAFPVAVLSTQTQSAWIDVHIPTNAPSGYYSGSVYVSSGGVVISTLPVVLGVWNWVMPSTASLQMRGPAFGYNGFNNVAYGTGAADGATYPDAGGRDRANMYEWLDGSVQLLDNRWTNYSPNYIYPNEGSFSDYNTNMGPLLNGTTAHIHTILPAASLNAISLGFSVSTTTAYTGTTWQNWATNHTNQVWFNRLDFKICDEPPSGCTWANLIFNGNLTRSLSTPVIPNFVTTDLADVKTNSSIGVVDQLAPLISNVEGPHVVNNRPDYDAWLGESSGPVRQVGSYNDCVQGGTCANTDSGTGLPVIGAANNPPFPNKHIDGKPVANRAMETWMFLYRMQFEHYFEVDYCDTHPTVAVCGAVSPWLSVRAFGGNGDGTIMYPSTTTFVTTSSNIPIWCPSIRLKHFRDGMQDYEYENYLTKAGSGTLVQAQIASWMTNGYTFNMDPAGIEAARTAMGNAIHSLSFTPVPVVTVPALQSLTLGDAVNFQITASNSPTSYSAVSLPSGVTVDATTGLVTGSPATAGVYFPTIRATNANGTGQETLTIQVTGVPAPPASIANTEVFQGQIIIRGQAKLE